MVITTSDYEDAPIIAVFNNSARCQGIGTSAPVNLIIIHVRVTYCMLVQFHYVS